MKHCTACKQTKPLTDFHKKGDSHHSRCKLCRNASNRAWNVKSEYKRTRTPNPTRQKGVSVSKKFWRSLYKKRVRQATPEWVRFEYKDQMKYLYDLRDEASVLIGEEYHLDHIVPLNHPDICGLNVPWNLQVLPAILNLEKGNKWEPEKTLSNQE
jgi:hypothetical protein